MAGRQGFASMTLEQRRAIARKGGAASHALGVAHRWTPEEARAAGRKGGLKGQATHRARRAAKIPAVA